MVVLPVYGCWYLRWLRDCVWVRVVVHLLLWWTPDNFPPAGMYAILLSILVLISYPQSHFHQCSTLFPEIGCDMFTNVMSHRATTMSLSILVTVEMFNAMNSLSENESLLVLPVWKNPFLVAAITLSMALHFAILYIPFFTVSNAAEYL